VSSKYFDEILENNMEAQALLDSSNKKIFKIAKTPFGD